MKDNPLVPFAFDPTEFVREAQTRFGWSETDLNSVMASLMTAATSGMRVLSGQPGLMPQLAPGAIDPFSLFKASLGQEDDAPHLAMVYGPRPVREAVAAQIASLTGLQRDAIMDMMPVAATLALGQIARPYVPEEGRELLDAFMRGYARGRPKPPPSPTEFFQGYANAMQSFWSGFLRPFADQPVPQRDEVMEEPEAEDEDLEALETAEDAPDNMAPSADSEETGFDAMVNDWMTRSREMQVSQFKAFDSLFERAVRDGGVKGD